MHWSHEQIAGRLRAHPELEVLTGRVCAETIYRFVYDLTNLDMELYPCRVKTVSIFALRLEITAHMSMSPLNQLGMSLSGFWLQVQKMAVLTSLTDVSQSAS